MDRPHQLGTSTGTLEVPHSGQSSSGDPCVTITQAPKGKSEDVKVELVNSARQKWPLNFSRFYEVTMVSGESTHHLLGLFQLC